MTTKPIEDDEVDPDLRPTDDEDEKETESAGEGDEPGTDNKD